MWIPLLAVVLSASLLNPSAGAFDPPAPFGFSWGPVGNVPRPSFATREANITQLTYRDDRLPSDELPDTEEIVLEGCKNEVLQHIILISRFLSNAEEQDRSRRILAEATRRYGSPEILGRGIISWTVGRTLMARISNGLGRGRILMASTGPGFNTCSEEHKSTTG